LNPSLLFRDFLVQEFVELNEFFVEGGAGFLEARKGGWGHGMNSI